MQIKTQIGEKDRLKSRACWCWLLFWVMLLAVATGCGQKRTLTPVSGKITYRGKPLQFGSVMFQSRNGQPATGTINSDGTFKMTTQGEGDGAPVGPVQVRIICFESQGPNPPRDGTQGKPFIPKKYTSYATSGITFEVKPGENEPLNLDLSDSHDF